MFGIRPFERTEADYKAVARLQAATWADCLNSVAMWKRAEALRDPRSLVQRLVAVDQGDIVGLAVLLEPERQYEQGKYDLSIAVRPDHQRKGIGSALVIAGQEWAKHNKSRRLILEIQPKNFPAIQLARKLGFELCGYNDHYFSNHDIAIFFSKWLR